MNPPNKIVLTDKWHADAKQVEGGDDLAYDAHRRLVQNLRKEKLGAVLTNPAGGEILRKEDVDADRVVWLKAKVSGGNPTTEVELLGVRCYKRDEQPDDL